LPDRAVHPMGDFLDGLTSAISLSGERLQDVFGFFVKFRGFSCW
jgi:hypothetical protein